jgi:integrase
VALVRSIYADLGRGDFTSVDWANPQMEYVLMDGPSPGTFTGLTEIASGLREMPSLWKDPRDVIDEYRVRRRELPQPGHGRSDPGTERKVRAGRSSALPERLTPHSLRRTFASLLYALGEDSPVVMSEMGHADPALALRIYAQATRREDDERRKLGALVEGTGF